VRRDLPEGINTGAPVKPVFALSQLAPRTTERIVARIGLDRMFERSAELPGRGNRSAPAPIGRPHQPASIGDGGMRVCPWISGMIMATSSA
jgi:hypothetical protein